VLKATIAEDPNTYGEPAARDVLHGIIAIRQSTLEARALVLGAKLFAEPTKPLAKRWGMYWDVWRSEACWLLSIFGFGIERSAADRVSSSASMENRVDFRS
jgi:hypothetical protein